MELTKKVKILTWLLIFFIALDISAVTVMFLHIKSHERNIKNHSQNFRQNNFHNQIIRKLELSGEQLQTYNALRTEFMADTRRFIDSMRKYNLLINSELENNNTDTNKINLYIKKISQTNAKLKHNYVNYMLKLKKNLTPGQRRKFFRYYRRFRKRHFQNFKN